MLSNKALGMMLFCLPLLATAHKSAADDNVSVVNPMEETDYSVATNDAAEQQLIEQELIEEQPIEEQATENEPLEEPSDEELNESEPQDESDDYEDEFVFDNSMFRGSQIQQDVINRLSQKNTTEPGTYDITIKTNDRASGQDSVVVALINNKPEICLSESLLDKAGFLPKYQKTFASLQKQKADCVTLSQIVPEAKVELASDLTLNFSAPQAVLKYRSPDAVEISELDSGSTVAFANYTVNQYHNEQSGHASGSSDYSYLNLNAGINFGLWQFRQLSSYSYNNGRYNGTNTTNSKWNNISSYVQRAFPSIQSKLIAGETNTTGQFLSGLSYTGFELASDERMLPISQQGYAPVVSGIARTNAVVEVRQNNSIIYQTMVPSGAFEIRDLNPTNFSGDLDVTVREADGSISTFSVPFSAVPDSVRPGRFKYSMAAGKTRDLITDEYFFDTNLQYGLSNSLTLGAGSRLAQNYQAGVLSTVYANDFGAFGLNTTVSNANLGNGNNHQGWMASLTYSKSLKPTNTNIALAGYRYSSQGYREFTDFVNERYNINNSGDYNWSSSSYLQQYRLMMTVSQPLGDYGSLGFSASTQEYRNGQPKDTQYQVNYSKMLPKGVSLGLNVSRQKTNRFMQNDTGAGSYKSKNNTLTMVSLSIPLGSSRSSISSSATFDRENGNTYQNSISGNFGAKENPYNYSMNVSYDDRNSQTSYAANMSKQHSLGTTTVNASHGKDYWQAGASMTGSVVAHSGGVIAGPYLSDTFAIVEAKGAEGAKVFNGQGAEINRSGYALVPSLVPYRYNSIGLTTDGMDNNNVDIESGQQKIAPYAGAAVKVKFGTNTGYPVLITLKQNDEPLIPMGALIVDADNKELGMVGQNNQAYFRAPDKKGMVKAVWGEQPHQQCTANYSINSSQLTDSLIKLSAQCALV